MTQMVYTKDLKPLLDDRYIKNKATIIPNGSSSSSPNSLNNYMGLGFYCQSNPVNITELPESGKGFFLLVEDFGTRNYTKQTLTHTESNKTYTRIRNEGLWSSWREISAGTTYSKGDGLLLDNNVFSVDFGSSTDNSSTKVVACNDDRLKNTRTPTDNTVSTAKIQNYAVDFTKTQEFSADGGVSTAGYVKVMQITIGGPWKDMPIIFEIFSRSKGVSYVTLMFKNDSGNDPLVNAFTYTGAENEIYIVKNSTSKWDIAVKKPANDKIVIKNLQQPHSYVSGGVTFERVNTFLSSAPTLGTNDKQATFIGFTSTEKTKLSGIDTGANKTTIANNLTTATAGSALDATQGKWLYDNKLGNQEITTESQLDLNHANYQIPGTYYCTLKETVKQMSNTPWQTAPSTNSLERVGYSFSLVVLKNAGVTQILKPSRDSGKYSNYIYIRDFSNGQWTNPSDSGNNGWYQLSIDGRDYENTSNKTNTMDTNNKSTKYPTVEAVEDYIDEIIGDINEDLMS